MRPSHAGNASKLITVGSCTFYHRLAQVLWFSDTRFHTIGRFSTDKFRKRQNDRRQADSYNERLIGSRIRAFDWYQFQWPWTAVTHRLTLYNYSRFRCVAANEDRPMLSATIDFWLLRWTSNKLHPVQQPVLFQLWFLVTISVTVIDIFIFQLSSSYSYFFQLLLQLLDF